MTKRNFLTAGTIAAILLTTAAMSGTGTGQSSRLYQDGDRLFLVEKNSSGERTVRPAGAVWDGVSIDSGRAKAAPAMQSGTMVVEGDYAYLVERVGPHVFKRRVAAVWDGNLAGPDRAPTSTAMQSGKMVVEGDYAYLVETVGAHVFKRRVAAVWDGSMPVKPASARQQAQAQAGEQG